MTVKVAMAGLVFSVKFYGVYKVYIELVMGIFTGDMVDPII